MREFSPLHAVDSNGPIEFEIPPHMTSCYKLGQAMLTVKVKLVKEGTTTKPDNSSKTTIANNGLNALFHKSLIQINDIALNNCVDGHHLRSFLHVLISSNRDQAIAPLGSTLSTYAYAKTLN